MPRYIDARAVERFLKNEITECERDMKESCRDEFFEAAVDCRETAFRQVLCEIGRMPSRAIRTTKRWIRADEAVPASLTRVLVFVRDGGTSEIGTDRYVGGGWAHYCRAVTHWMPLPDAPEGAGRCT